MLSEKDLNEKFDQELSKLKKEIKKPNIFIVGGTGVGKSSLINKIFGKKESTVSDANPETRGIKAYPHKDVVLLDTEGFELGSDKNEIFENTIISEIERRKSGDVQNQVHLIWHLIAASSERVTDYDINLYKKLLGFGLPVAVIFTKSDIANEASMDSLIKRIYPDMTFNEAFANKGIPPFFISSTTEDEQLSPVGLINWSTAQLPKALKYAFTSSQILNYEAKFEEAKTIINQHTAGNAAVSFTPVPFSDAPILIASQVGMLTRIFRLYNLSDINIGAFMSTTGTGLVISNLGKSAVGSLLKFIPVVGTIVGGVINAAVAGTITFAMGTALNVLLKKITVDHLKGDLAEVKSTMENFGQLFKDNFADEFNKRK